MLQIRKLRRDSKLFGKLEEIAALYNSGCSTCEIAKKYNIDKSHIVRLLNECGVKMRTKSESGKLAFSKGRARVFVGKENPSWRGGRHKDSRGYVLVYQPNHHRAMKGHKYVYEHILVAEKKAGRLLKNNECVHHKNGIKHDNRPENLQVMTALEHRKLHAKLENGRIGINQTV